MMIGPYTITRGAVLPYEEEFSSDQVIQKDGNGDVIVSGNDYTDSFLKVTISAEKELLDTIANFLKNNNRFAALPFTLVDGFGVTKLVRLWDNKFKKVYQGNNFGTIEIIVREEV